VQWIAQRWDLAPPAARAPNQLALPHLSSCPLVVPAFAELVPASTQAAPRALHSMALAPVQLSDV